jgi:hypothetical protein
MPRRAMFRWREGRSASWQVLAVVFSGLYVIGLHLNNDGLWYQGDAPRHAANGLFWWDFIANFPVQPFEFALSYYARYPVINPTAYPPVFYLLEGAAFSLFGASPFVAKGLVSAFALLAGLYATAWLRRWIAEEAGWGGALLVLQPGIIAWSNAIMLNIPSMAIGLAALYHARRWLETPTSRHVYRAALFTALGIFTYFPCGIVILVILAWVVAERLWMVLAGRRALTLTLLFALIFLPLAVVAVRWAPMHAGLVFPNASWAFNLGRWTYYLGQLPRVLSTALLGLVPLSIVAGICDRRWRREVKLALVWATVCYAVLSYIVARDTRYALLLAPPVVILAIIGLFSFVRWGATRLGVNPSRCSLAAMAALLALHASTAPLVRVPVVEGFQEVVAFFEREAPNERIFYDGSYNGVFSLYMRARDPDFRRGVVLGNKLLYASAIYSGWRLTERVSSPAEVVDVLRRECGCQWLAIERWKDADRIAAARYLRQAVTGPEFQFVKSFPIVAHGVTQVDVYRFLLPAEKPDELELPFPILGEGVKFRAKPIER